MIVKELKGIFPLKSCCYSATVDTKYCSEAKIWLISWEKHTVKAYYVFLIRV